MVKQQSYLFKGFSTAAADKTGRRDWTLYDDELIKRDLMNEFMTSRGERWGRPEYGSIIWNYIEDQLTAHGRDDIVTDVLRICNADDRVEVDQSTIVVYQRDHVLLVGCTITNRATNGPIQLSIAFENREAGSR